MIAATDDYASFAERVRKGGLLSDPWLCGKPRFSTGAITLASADCAAIAETEQSDSAAARINVFFMKASLGKNAGPVTEESATGPACSGR